MKRSIIDKNGAKYVVVYGKAIHTLSFKSFRPTKNNVFDFYKAVVRIFHVYCLGFMSALKVPYSRLAKHFLKTKLHIFEHLAMKMHVNILSIATMAKMGRIYGNCMVNLKKLVDRATCIIADLCDVSYEKANYEFFLS